MGRIHFIIGPHRHCAWGTVLVRFSVLLGLWDLVVHVLHGRQHHGSRFQALHHGPSDFRIISVSPVLQVYKTLELLGPSSRFWLSEQRQGSCMGNARGIHSNTCIEDLYTASTPLIVAPLGSWSKSP